MPRPRLALIALSAGLIACTPGDDAADAAAAEVVEAADEATTTTATEDPPSTEATASAAPFDASIPILDAAFREVTPGVHRFDQLGMEFVITVPAAISTQPLDAGHVVLTELGSTGPGDDDLVFFRPEAFIDPTSTLDNVIPWPVDDFDGWLAAVSDRPGLTSKEATVDGRTATLIEISTDECQGICLGIAETPGNVIFVQQGYEYRLWHVPVDGEAPILVFLGTTSVDPTWAEIGLEMLRSVRFGPDAPHPLDGVERPWEVGIPDDVPAGPVTIPIAGGISFELNEDRFVFQTEGYAGVHMLDLPGQNDIFLAASTQGGTIDSLATGVELLSEHPALVVDGVTGTTVAGFDAVELTIQGRSSEVLSWAVPFTQPEVWYPPIKGTIWLIDIGAEHPLAITSETFGDESVLERTDATAARILETLEVG